MESSKYTQFQLAINHQTTKGRLLYRTTINVMIEFLNKDFFFWYLDHTRGNCKRESCSSRREETKTKLEMFQTKANVKLWKITTLATILAYFCRFLHLLYKNLSYCNECGAAWLVSILENKICKFFFFLHIWRWCELIFPQHNK